MEEEVAEKESIDDTLKATLSEIQGRGEVDEPEVTEAAHEKPAKSRDETGKFAKAEKVAKVETVEPEPVDPGLDVNRAPSSWKPGAKAVWEKVDPAIRGEIHRREADFMKGQAQLIPDAELGRGLKQIAQPYQAMIDAEGGSIQGALQDYLKTASILRMGTPDQKRNALLGIARSFGVDLGQQQIDPNAQQQQNPYQQNQPLDPRVDQLMNYLQTQEQNRSMQEKQAADRSVDSWMAETDPKGQPLRPYLENVLDVMQEKIPSLRSAHPEWTHQQVLQEAYDRSCREDPEVSEVIFEQRLAAEQLKRREENLQRVDSAKRAAGVPSARREPQPTTAPLGSMDDTIRETYRALQG